MVALADADVFQEKLLFFFVGGEAEETDSG
jgi:hypothetical protein